MLSLLWSRTWLRSVAVCSSFRDSSLAVRCRVELVQDGQLGLPIFQTKFPPSRGHNVYRTASSKKILFAPAERKKFRREYHAGKIALRWSAVHGVLVSINIWLRWSQS